ncbi:hypothetical protein BGZ81_000661 [Podila clonocystis]|nr:hypothetical protein BGZ81_000661 [Podila clonocystis]
MAKSVGTIYSYPGNPRLHKALIVAKYNGLQVDVSKDFAMGTTNNSPEWIAKYGTTQVPIFEGTDGTIIFESGAIAHYLAHNEDGSSLVGKNLAEETHIQQWMQFVDVSIGPTLGRWVFPLVRTNLPYNKAVETDAIAQVKDKLKILEDHFVKNTYLVGERVTLADISAITTLHNGFRLVFDPTFCKEYPALTRWFTTIVNQHNVKAITGDFVFCETVKKYTPPPKGKKEKKKSKEDKKPKEGKRPREKENAEDEEESFQDAPKPKSKLDLLPAAKMPLDEWKRQYSNNDTPVATKWLWENIDLTSDYSFWKVDYKYNDELTKIYMSNNLAGGLLNRLERARKYAFGCLVVAGKDNANIITGYFIIRGNADEMIEEVIDAADYESYNWVKVKVDDAERAKIDQIFAWKGTVDGKLIQDGKVIK